mmetsp:Transcript_7097/g.7980  ORF Transcript_7097/g.7980 Transcript_7097/m.7980 type:complete len:83 (-) Transcript_7097:39-287(-)
MWNSSMFYCRKGCDFSMGRMQDPDDRLEAENMCKMLSSTLYVTHEDYALEDIDDLRIHGWQYSMNADNVYKACLAGIRRQKY